MLRRLHNDTPTLRLIWWRSTWTHLVGINNEAYLYNDVRWWRHLIVWWGRGLSGTPLRICPNIHTNYISGKAAALGHRAERLQKKPHIQIHLIHKHQNKQVKDITYANKNTTIFSSKIALLDLFKMVMLKKWLWPHWLYHVNLLFLNLVKKNVQNGVVDEISSYH